jgi:tetratricopeptide (TPR) repeat protein
MSRSQRVAEWLRQLYPPDPDDTDWIGSLQPDRLAELHAVQELMASPRFARVCLSKLNPRQALRAVTLLARASSDYQSAQEFLKQMLPSVTDIVADLQGPIEMLTTIYNAIPSMPGNLASVAATLCQRIINLLPTDAGPSARAFWLNQLGIRFWQLERWAEASTVEQEAIEIYRDLDASAPDSYHPRMANSLAVLSFWFWQQDHRAEALTAEQEAIKIYRELAAYEPAQYGPQLAANLSSLGDWLWRVGRATEALPITQEATENYRELSAARPDRYRPDLFRNLRILASIHEALDQIVEANTIHKEIEELIDKQPNVDWGKT